jgi:protein-S-isoprenylcysteine O-methyltransferase Ste14
MGICNNCGQSFCDRCLYVTNVRGGQLYLCPECYQDQKRASSIAWIIIAALPMVGVVMSLIALASPQNTRVPSSVLIGIMMFGILFFSVVLLAASWSYKQKPLSIHDMRMREKE